MKIEKPYEYQQKIIDKIIQSNEATLVQLPTGGGKTKIATEVIKYFAKQAGKYQRVLFVAPKIILMEQTINAFNKAKLDPQKIHKQHKYRPTATVFVSTIQTARKRDLEVDIIIVDEVHYAYQGKSLQQLKDKNPRARIIGLSATPYNQAGKRLQGFDLFINDYDVIYLMQNNFLVPKLRQYELVQLKLDNIKIKAGDYDEGQLGDFVCNDNAIMEIVKTTSSFIKDSKKTIVFAVNIDHAERLTQAYKEAGFKAKALHSKSEKENGEAVELEDEIKAFRYGHTKVLVSVLMLTTGFDVPDTDCAVIARPTRSQNLYKQMVGRILRKADGKTEAILLDCGNIIKNLGMPLDPIVEREQNFKPSPQKCERCKSIKLKLIKKEDKLYWKCKECSHLKKVNQGHYKCEDCQEMYSYKNGIFIFEDGKLKLNCKCGHKTFISQHTNEEFVEVIDKKRKSRSSKILELFSRFKLERTQDNKNRLLIHFALKNDIANIKLLLQDGAEINETNTQGLNALELASTKNNIAVMELLFKKGSNYHISQYIKNLSFLNLIYFLIPKMDDLNISYEDEEENEENTLLIIAIKGLVDLSYAENSHNRARNRFFYNCKYFTNKQLTIKDFQYHLKEINPLVNFDKKYLINLNSIYYNIIKLLLQNSADVNYNSKEYYFKRHYNEIPLDEAIKSNHTDTVKLLLEYGADVNYDENDNPAIIEAIQNKNLEIVQLLFDSNANIYAIEQRDQNTTLIEAVKTNNINIVKLFLNQGIDINYSESKTTALIEAIRKNNLEMVQLLLNHGANTNQYNSNNISIENNTRKIQSFLNDDIYLHGQESTDTPLIEAIYQNNFALVQLLLDNNANPLQKNKINLNAVTLVALKEDVKMLKLLIGNSIDVNTVMKEECNIVNYARVNDNKKIISSINTQDINMQDSEGNTALLKIIQNRNFQMLKYLVEHNADINLANNNGITPLIASIQINQNQLRKEFSLFLLEQNINVDMQDKDGNSALLYAVQHPENLKIVQILLEKDANIDLVNNKGQKAIDLSQTKKITKSLINHSII